MSSARGRHTALGNNLSTKGVTLAATVMMLSLAATPSLAPAYAATNGHDAVKVESATGSLKTLLAPTVRNAAADPVVQTTQETEMEFAIGVVDEEYLSTTSVSQAQGDSAQIEAVEQSLSSDVPDADLNGIARIDLDADVAVLGVTWSVDGEDPEGVYWRYLSGGIWSEWGELDEESRDSGVSSVAGTEPLAIANADAVEVVAKTESGTPPQDFALHVISSESFDESSNSLLDVETLAEGEQETEQQEEPADLEPQEVPAESDTTLEHVDQSETAEESQSGQSEPLEPETLDGLLDTEGAVESDAAGLSGFAASLNSSGTFLETGYEGLTIGTRKAWCNGDYACLNSRWAPEPITVRGAVVHHTQGNNAYSQAQVPQQIRNVYQYQANTLGWGDIGYNIIVDKYGRVWEGRQGGLDKGIKGAQAYGANAQTFGIVILGSYVSAPPPVVARQAMSKAIAWKLHTHGISSSTAMIQVPGEANLRAGNNKMISVPVVSAHKDVGWTDCPGEPFYAQMDLVRSEVQAHLNKLSAAKATVFNAGNVIEDSVFYNSAGMNEGEIKAFIQKVGANCKSTSTSTCLKDLTVSTAKLNPVRIKAGGCTTLNLTGPQKPWTVIDRAAKACGLNPKVILVTLQKEQSGLTQPRTEAVWAKAMGAGCPDGSGCNPSEAGFAKQIYYGAEKLATYKIKATWEQYILAFQSGSAVTVQNNPGNACGSETFKLSNYATASLYMYTPYIGNGSGSGCGAIGQKMFWNLMKTYFPSDDSNIAEPTAPTGWIKDGSNWMYADATGRIQTGWVSVGGSWYYFNSSGIMQTGWLQQGANWYYIYPGGNAATGWAKVGGSWYFFNPGGSMRTGWLQQGSAWYYLNAGGSMATGNQSISGRVNSFSTGGVWLGYAS